MLRPITLTGTKISLNKTRLVTINIKTRTKVRFGRGPNKRRRKYDLKCRDPEYILTCLIFMRYKVVLYNVCDTVTILNLPSFGGNHYVIAIVGAPAPFRLGWAICPYPAPVMAVGLLSRRSVGDASPVFPDVRLDVNVAVEWPPPSSVFNHAGQKTRTARRTWKHRLAAPSF